MEIEYKNHRIVTDFYFNENKKCYKIYNPLGVLIVDTLWNDDKMWSTDEEAISSAKRSIDNPEQGYIKLFQKIE